MPRGCCPPQVPQHERKTCRSIGPAVHAGYEENDGAEKDFGRGGQHLIPRAALILATMDARFREPVDCRFVLELFSSRYKRHLLEQYQALLESDNYRGAIDQVDSQRSGEPEKKAHHPLILSTLHLCPGEMTLAAGSRDSELILSGELQCGPDW